MLRKAGRAKAVGPIGAAAHEQGVYQLLRSWRELSPEGPVRLAKATSNLFRPRDRAQRGLDVSGLAGAISVDPVARTVDVQGMCTYETLVDVTLAYGLMPLVVPQLRTITLGGAVTGLGIEATSFRNGLPHESVLEMDVLTGSGEIVTADPEGPHADLFDAFPNSYGSLGYAVRLRIALQPIGTHISTRNLRFTDLGELAEVVDAVCRTGAHDGVRVDGLDGVVFGPGDAVLVLATFDGIDGAPTGSATPSDYVDGIYYQSLRDRATDRLTAHDYLWRWDTDWFWCSSAFGVQDPRIRRLWPRSLRRSDVYHRIVGLENRFHIAAGIDRRRGLPDRERVVQDVEVPLGRLVEFVDWYLDNVPMTPIWLCPLRLREPAGPGSARSWPLYPLVPGEVYVNVGFWGTVAIEPRRSDGDVNRAIETRVSELDGHKSLYSDVYYDRATFDRLYGTAALDAVRERYDPTQRLTHLYDKVAN